MLVIPIRGSDRNELSLVHCAVPRGKARRIEEYLAKVASRSVLQDAASQRKPRKLTARERQILHLLAEDHDLYTIADELCISYATVRNHIQHILAKLHVHSIMEAVARHLASGLRSAD
jgi:DNA-binding NarL/FixJ family response regulator